MQLSLHDYKSKHHCRWRIYRWKIYGTKGDPVFTLGAYLFQYLTSHFSHHTFTPCSSGYIDSCIIIYMQTIGHHIHGICPWVTHRANCWKICWDQLQFIQQYWNQWHLSGLESFSRVWLYNHILYKSSQKFRKSENRKLATTFVYLPIEFHWSITPINACFLIKLFSQIRMNVPATHARTERPVLMVWTAIPVTVLLATRAHCVRLVCILLTNNKITHFMMVSCHGHILRITGHLWGEPQVQGSTSQKSIVPTKG